MGTSLLSAECVQWCVQWVVPGGAWSLNAHLIETQQTVGWLQLALSDRRQWRRKTRNRDAVERDRVLPFLPNDKNIFYIVRFSVKGFCAGLFIAGIMLIYIIRAGS